MNKETHTHHYYTEPEHSKDYVIAIPSYNRPDGLREKTLTMLKENKIPSEKIYVFLHNQKEASEYERAIPKDMYGRIVVTNLNKGLVGQREYIEEYFKEGQHIVSLDDDVEEVILSHSPLFKDKSLDYFFKTAFETCIKEGAYIWGVYPVNNPFYLKGQEVTTHLTYIVGAFFGIINRPHNKKLQLEITRENGQKEDVERTILYYIQDKKVVRFNRVTFKTKYYGKTGGLGTFEERLKPMLIASEKLEKKYGEYGYVKTRPNGMTEFVLYKNPKIKGGKITKPIENVSDKENPEIIVDKIEHTPKIKELQERIVRQLDQIKLIQTDPNRTKKIGKGFCIHFGAGRKKFRPNGEFKANKLYPELFKDLTDYGNTILPTGYQYEMITINKNLKAKKHTDIYNTGIGFITILGDYTGGGLYIYEKGKAKLYDTHNTLIGFNGALYPHRTEAFKGTRYALIFFKQIGEKVKGVHMEGSGITEEYIEKVY